MIKNLCVLIFAACAFITKAQCPWNFTVTNQSGFTLTCLITTVNLSSVNNNTNSVTYNWTGPSFSATSASVGLTQAGNYTLELTDITTSCAVTQTFDVITNTTTPHISVSMLTYTLTCNHPTLLATASSTSSNTGIGWLAPGVIIQPVTPTIVIGPPNGPPTTSASLTYGNYTVIATNTINACSTTSIIQISQNFKPPAFIPVIYYTSPKTVCSNSPVILTYSLTQPWLWQGPVPYPTNIYWQGPAPQTPTNDISSYKCYVPGEYTITIGDNYNGCLATKTINISDSRPKFNLTGWAPTNSLSCNGTAYVSPQIPDSCTISINTGSLSGNTISNLCYGKLLVCITNTITNCTKCDSLEINATTAIREGNLKDHFIIYPNPSNGNVFIKGIENKNFSIKLFNVEGKEIERFVLEREASTGSATSEIKNLDAGIYFVELNIEGVLVRKKIIVLNR